LNAGYPYLEVRCLGCDTHQTVALDVVRRPRLLQGLGDLDVVVTDDLAVPAVERDWVGLRMDSGRARRSSPSSAIMSKA
jgi:hypothetical protein